jgi:hypothetical protein
VITFSGAVQAASLTLDTTLDDGACTGAIQVSSDEFVTCIPFSSGTASLAGNVATLTPSPHFSFGSSYKVRVTSSALDAGGAAVTAFTLPTAFTTRTDATSSVVISQAYGGGGNAGATFLNDFVELHNRSSIPVDISGWSVQYTSATGTTWQVTNIPAATILQHHLAAVVSGQAFVEGKLSALQPLIIYVGYTHDVCRRVTGRIVASIFTLEVHTGDAQGARGLVLIPGRASFQIDELALAVLTQGHLQRERVDL